MKTARLAAAVLVILCAAAGARAEEDHCNPAKRAGETDMAFQMRKASEAPLCALQRMKQAGQAAQQLGQAAQAQQQAANDAKAAGKSFTPLDERALLTWIHHKVSAARQPFCYRQSYGDTAGVPLSTCSADQEKDGLLCYPKCKDGYGGAGPVCWHRCPSGYLDTGALCHIDKALTRSGHWHCPHWYNCRKECPSGYTNAGLFCALNTPSNPPGWSGTGLDLTKDSYGRGAGSPMQCAAGQQQSGALCYPPCKAGFHLEGPVCWQNCSADQVACGAGCANSKTSCATNTANMVISPIMLAANIITLGGSSELEGAKASFVNAVKAGDKATARAALEHMSEVWASNMAKLTTEDVSKQLEKKLSQNAAKYIAKQYARMNYYEATGNDPSLRSAISDASGLDPTGVASVIDAYTQPVCASDEPMPNVNPLN